MNETMGQIIRRLRREQRITQEELANVIGVTFQAVSKWENDKGMPDVSQVVPLARALGVNTDALFGVAGNDGGEEVREIIARAQSFLTVPLDSAGMMKKYRELQKGLKEHPTNERLLVELLDAGVALAYPESRTYDAEYAEAIYYDCTRCASVIVSFARNTSNVMRAHMALVMLHSAYGNFRAAYDHVEQFPTRADFNRHVMQRFFAHWRKEYDLEISCCQYANLHYINATLDSVTNLATAYLQTERHEEAIKTIESALDLIACIFKEDTLKPPVHYREHDDLYALLAEAHLKNRSHDSALVCLEAMVEYDLSEYSKITEDTKTVSPLLRAKARELYVKRIDRFAPTLEKLTSARFNALKTDPRYIRLLDRVRAAAL